MRSGFVESRTDRPSALNAGYSGSNGSGRIGLPPGMKPQWELSDRRADFRVTAAGHNADVQWIPLDIPWTHSNAMCPRYPGVLEIFVCVAIRTHISPHFMEGRGEGTHTWENLCVNKLYNTNHKVNPLYVITYVGRKENVFS